MRWKGGDRSEMKDGFKRADKPMAPRGKAMPSGELVPAVGSPSVSA